MSGRCTPASLLGVAAIVALPLVAAEPAAAQHPRHVIMDLVGLQDRLGASTPTGAGIVVGQVEAANPGQAYAPDVNLADITGKNFVAMSGSPGTAVGTAHATEVAKWGYGTLVSMAPDVDDIHLWGAASWLQSGSLRVGQGGANEPLPPPNGMKLSNHSWIGTMNNVSLDNEAIRRTDFAANRDGVLFLVGVANDPPDRPLMRNSYNGLSVGTSAGIHQFTNTSITWEGGGRMKPEICAPDNFTSYATPQVMAAAALMVETARTWPGLASNPNAELPEVLKAVLLAGGQHDNQFNQWTNLPGTGPDRGVTFTPLDDRMGVGTVDVNASHKILTALEQDASTTIPFTPNASWAGWDLADVAPESSVYYRFGVYDLALEVSIILTWNREIDLIANQMEIARYTLTLWRADGTKLETLIGDPGIPYFIKGNVQSRSPVDNIEHLYIKQLQPGEYVLEVERTDNLTNPALRDAAVAWIMDEQFVPADVDEDGAVGFLDLLAVLSAWGSCSGCPEDVDGDGIVGFLDLLAVLSAWS